MYIKSHYRNDGNKIKYALNWRVNHNLISLQNLKNKSFKKSYYLISNQHLEELVPIFALWCQRIWGDKSSLRLSKKQCFVPAEAKTCPAGTRIEEI